MGPCPHCFPSRCGQKFPRNFRWRLRGGNIQIETLCPMGIVERVARALPKENKAVRLCKHMKAGTDPIIKVMEEMELQGERKPDENSKRNHTRAPGGSPLLRKRRRETSRPDPGVASHHAFGTAPKYPTTHATYAVGNEGNGSVCQTRVCQPGWEHQGPRCLLDPQAGGRAR